MLTRSARRIDDLGSLNVGLIEHVLANQSREGFVECDKAGYISDEENETCFVGKVIEQEAHNGVELENILKEIGQEDVIVTEKKLIIS